MPSVGLGMQEIRRSAFTPAPSIACSMSRSSRGHLRLHAFEKRTRRPPKDDLDLVRQPLHLLINRRARRKGRWSMKRVKLTRSSGNVFRDLGFSGEEAGYL